MYKLIKKYNDYFKFVLILVVILIIITIIHVVFRNIIAKNKTSLSTSIENISKDDAKYNSLKDDLDNIKQRINHAEDVSFNENIYMVDFYKNASMIYKNKLMEMQEIIKNKMIDEDEKSALSYDIEKFFLELDNDDAQKKRLYESTIEASLNIYKNRYEKTKERCYKLIDDYKMILDK